MGEKKRDPHGFSLTRRAWWWWWRKIVRTRGWRFGEIVPQLIKKSKYEIMLTNSRKKHGLKEGGVKPSKKTPLSLPKTE